MDETRLVRHVFSWFRESAHGGEPDAMGLVIVEGGRVYLEPEDGFYGGFLRPEDVAALSEALQEIAPPSPRMVAPEATAEQCALVGEFLEDLLTDSGMADTLAELSEGGEVHPRTVDQMYVALRAVARTLAARAKLTSPQG